MGDRNSENSENNNPILVSFFFSFFFLKMQEEIDDLNRWMEDIQQTTLHLFDVYDIRNINPMEVNAGDDIDINHHMSRIRRFLLSSDIIRRRPDCSLEVSEDLDYNRLFFEEILRRIIMY
jgi:hypothetical protein